MPAANPTSGEPQSAIVLFDGVCNLCNWAVTFIAERDPALVFRFASLQSARAQELLALHAMPRVEGAPDSVVLLEGDEVYTHSAAALRIAKRLRWPWCWLYVGIFVPRFVRDPVYRWIAANRYRWFGKDHTCRVPTPELRRRFIP